jgi:hypothetical protein
MSLEHKAFAFDWVRFTRGLQPTLLRALADDNSAILEKYIERHRNELRDPYEGEPLTEDWRDLLENEGVQEFADFTLTRHYRPAEDRGIGYGWSELRDELPEPQAAAMLGKSLGACGVTFDPGRMGAYFQTPVMVRRSLQMLATVRRPELKRFRNLLNRCAVTGSGLYVTF